MGKTYQDFKDAVGMRESTNDYTNKNPWGFLGRYQFGKARLSDFGLTEKRVVNGRISFEWKAPFSEAIFRGTPALQDALFDAHVMSLKKSIERGYTRYLNTTISDTLLTLSGAVACCHLLGLGGLEKFVKGESPKDALGTSAKDYISLFAGYELPEKIGQVDFASLIQTQVI